MLTETDLRHLRRCVELAEKALAGGNPPFGSLLVGASGEVLFEDCNQTASGDMTHHPEFSIARWASMHLRQAERASATVYTSGEHCPMCAAAHGWVGLGRIVYASSSAQLGEWLAQWGVARSRVRTLPIEQVIEGVRVDGPAPELADAIRELQRRHFDSGA
ncbi:MAG: nucleoside deaminase [Burkholderiaceae bacterium]